MPMSARAAGQYTPSPARGRAIQGQIHVIDLECRPPQEARTDLRSWRIPIPQGECLDPRLGIPVEPREADQGRPYALVFRKRNHLAIQYLRRLAPSGCQEYLEGIKDCQGRVRFD